MKTITLEQALKQNVSWDVASVVIDGMTVKSLEGRTEDGCILYEVYDHTKVHALVYAGEYLGKAVLSYNAIE